MRMPLTAKQRRVLNLVGQLIARNGDPPTVRELAAALDCHPNNVHQFVTALVRKGYLTRTRGARGLSMVLEKGSTEAAAVPILGRIAAGAPIVAIAEGAEQIQVGLDVAGSGDLYALRVRGQSMVEDHILDGDMVIVRHQTACEDGDVVVALMDDNTATLKRIYREGSSIRLQPANGTMSPIYVQPGHVMVQGKVVAIIRRCV